MWTAIIADGSDTRTAKTGLEIPSAKSSWMHMLTDTHIWDEAETKTGSIGQKRKDYMPEETLFQLTYNFLMLAYQ